jgi:hypothetical protein
LVTGAGLLGMLTLDQIGADPLRVARTVEPGPIYSPDPKRHEFYQEHHREYRALRRGMVVLGETLNNLQESFL